MSATACLWPKRVESGHSSMTHFRLPGGLNANGILIRKSIGEVANAD